MKSIQKLLLITFIFLWTLKVSAIGANLTVQPADSVFNMMKKVADWQWNELETKGWKNPKTDWTNGVMYTGMTAWTKVAHNPVYYDKLLDVGKSLNWEIGPNRSFADDYCIAQMYAQLYCIYKKPLYIADFKKMADSLVSAPHSENL